VADLPRIAPTENGPYRVEGLDRLLNSRGEPLEARDVVYLCRCGGSQNKPFCDGTHAKIGFRGRRESRRQISRRRAYEGREITIHDNRAICAHAGFCTDSLPAAFRSGRKPWIDADGAPAEEIAETIRRCPSGALAYSLGGVDWDGDGRQPAITVSKDGPYWVIGSIELVYDGPRGPSQEHFALCRCGQSKNKPFCDGSHWYAGFSDPEN